MKILLIKTSVKDELPDKKQLQDSNYEILTDKGFLYYNLDHKRFEQYNGNRIVKPNYWYKEISEEDYLNSFIDLYEKRIADMPERFDLIEHFLKDN